MPKHFVQQCSTTPAGTVFACSACEFMVLVFKGGSGHNLINRGDDSVRHASPRTKRFAKAPAPFNLGP